MLQNHIKFLRTTCSKILTLTSVKLQMTFQLAIESRQWHQKNALVTVKDRKENFETNPKFRLINPAKSELDKISKITLDNINSQIRKRTELNQWKNSLSVIDWFNNIKNKPDHSFLTFDIAEFYPSITEELLDKAIAWAQNYVTISE